MIINVLASVGRPFTETRNVAIILFTLLGFVCVISAQFPLLILYIWLLSLGMALGMFILQRYVTPPSLWVFDFLLKLKYQPYKIKPVATVKYVQCPVCDKQHCRRHEVSVKSDNIWEGIYIPEKVDEKLEEFCQLLLVHHVYHWYHTISHNEDLIHDIRCLFRYVVAAIIRIAMELDLGKIVCEKLIPLGVVHLETYVKTAEKYPEIRDKDELAERSLRHMGPNLHIALTSPENENKYLRSLVELLLPYLLPESQRTSQKAVSFVRELVAMVMIRKGVELVAAPDFINLLIGMLLDPETMKEHKTPPSPQVELLNKFVGNDSANLGGLSTYYNLEDLLFNPNNLYSFMQYLRKQGTLNLLQCCLTVKEKLDTSSRDLTDTEIQFNAYKNEMRGFYDTYCAVDAGDRIHFPPELVDTFKRALFVKFTSGVNNPFRPVLQQIYNYLIEHLRSNHCAGFYQSDFFYLLLLGDRVIPPQSKLSSWSKLRKQSTGISTMFTAIKDKLSSNPMDPMMEILDESAFSAPQLSQLTATAAAAAFLGVEEEKAIDYNQRTNIDLTQWAIDIKNTEMLGEWLRQYVVYVISVKTGADRNTERSIHVTVKRRFSEFVMLHKRLRKFHGAMGGLQLPQRKSMNPLNSEFIDYRRRELCIYLQKILRYEPLKHSELVAKFLSPACDDFSKVGLSGMSKVAIGSAGEFAGKMMTSVRTKEKNLYLFPFLKSVCKSVDTRYGTSIGSEMGSNNSTPISTPTLPRKEMESPSGSKLDEGRKLQERIKEELEGRRTHQSTIKMQLTGVTECLLFTVLLLGKLPHVIIHALCSMFLVIKKTLDQLVISYINFKIGLVLQEKEIVELIELARDVLFFDTEVRGPVEWAERADATKNNLLNKIPKPVKKIAGVDRVEGALLAVFHCLQHSRLNKQLVFSLLDVFLGEVLQELKEREDIVLQQDLQDDTPE